MNRKHPESAAFLRFFPVTAFMQPALERYSHINPKPRKEAIYDN